MRRLTRNLINNSIEAYILALETVNRPSVSYRMEAFVFLFCNSWELLMKAKLLHDGKKIFYPKERKQVRRSLTLDDCLNRLFTAEHDPVKLNVQRISELRNEAIHLVVPFVPADVMGLFQAGVINYSKVLQAWFDVRVSQRVPLGMMALVYDFDPTEHSLENARMRRKLPVSTIRWLAEFQQSIRKQAGMLGQEAGSFFIPIDLKLAIVRNPDKADIVLGDGAHGEQALVVHVPKDPDRTHPYRRKEVVEQLRQRLSADVPVNSYDVHCVKNVYKVSSRPEFYYRSKFGSPQYSQQFVEWLVDKAQAVSGFFEEARRKARSLTVSGEQPCR